jgi:hypothetical protein
LPSENYNGGQVLKYHLLYPRILMPATSSAATVAFIAGKGLPIITASQIDKRPVQFDVSKTFVSEVVMRYNALVTLYMRVTLLFFIDFVCIAYTLQ